MRENKIGSRLRIERFRVGILRQYAAMVLFFCPVLLRSDVDPYKIHVLFFFSSRRRHTSSTGDWSSDVCSSDLPSTAEPRTARRVAWPRPGSPPAGGRRSK